MACSMANDLIDGFHPPPKVAANPSTAYPLEEIPLSAACTTTVIPASLANCQKPSNIGSKGDRRPTVVVGAAGRITMVRAPWSSAQVSSSTAQALSLIHISEPTRQAEISYAVFCL